MAAYLHSKTITATFKRILRRCEPPSFASVWNAVPVLALFALCNSAQALDGCRVLLCLAGSWQSIAECRAEVRQALRDVARGKPWPRCDMAAATGNSATHEWAAAPGNCPAQYTVPDGDGGTSTCLASGVVRVRINGMPWSHIWWDMGGETATEYSAEARARLGSAVDRKFDLDYATWRESQDRAAFVRQQATGY